MRTTNARVLRCRNCGSDWRGGRCEICGCDRFINVGAFYPWLAQGTAPGVPTDRAEGPR